MLPQEIIRHKRDKKVLTKSEIKEFIDGISTGAISNEQVAAMTMAMFLNGLNRQETIDLTLAMRDSGHVLSWHGFDKPIVDKHSSGGVGDKVSLMLAPILAACDVYVPMIAGRGLGHTGGTIDKLEAIPNYNTAADDTLFAKTVKNVGCAIIGQTDNLAPADKKIYAIRDVCGTVESIPLITASILSKKLAAGLQYLVMDLKCGNGAFMTDFESAAALAHCIVEVANGAGTKTSAVLTDMNQVLGKSAGNAVEVREALDYLQQKNIDSRLDVIIKKLCAQLLCQCGRCSDESEAVSLIEKVLQQGYALEKFAQMAATLGGPIDFVEKADTYLPQAAIKRPIFAEKAGFVKAMDTRAVGLAVIALKGGRTIPGEKLDLSTGFTNFVQIGDKIDAKTPLAVVNCQNESQYEAVRKNIIKAVEISDVSPHLTSPILQVI
jgi:thymidine phosphorylase